MNLKTMLDVEIEEQRNKLVDMKPGTKEYDAVVDALAKLMDRRIKIEEIEMSEAKADADRENAKVQSEQQLAEDRKSRFGKIIVDAGLGIAGIALTIWGTRTSLKFEETGTLTTQAGKKFMDKLFRR